MENQHLPFEFRNKPVSQETKAANWNAIQTAIEQQSIRKKRRPIAVVSFAIAFLLVLGGAWFFVNKNSNVPLAVVTTQYGEIKTIVLPDSSKVTLNANTSIRIPEDWEDTENREVWLDGEAYFQVQKKPATHQKFIVHIKNLDVEVLGTIFNINTHNKQSVVSLEEGKIQLSYEEKSLSNKKLSPAKVVLKPGDVAMVDTISNKLRLIHENDVAYRSGWSRHEFHFENTPLREIAQLVEKTYGYKMVAEDDSLMNKQVTGDLRAENVQEFVKVLEIALKLKMVIVDKQILVRQP